MLVLFRYHAIPTHNSHYRNHINEKRVHVRCRLCHSFYLPFLAIFGIHEITRRISHITQMEICNVSFSLSKPSAHDFLSLFRINVLGVGYACGGVRCYPLGKMALCNMQQPTQTHTDVSISAPRTTYSAINKRHHMQK